MRSHRFKRSLAAQALIVLAGFVGLGLLALPAWTQPPTELHPPRPTEPTATQPPPASPQQMILTVNEVVQWALRNNPALNTFRRTRGLAQAGIVIANQYPFNPIIQDYTWYGQGPASAGVTNHVFNEHTARLDLEWRHQGRYRRAMARAALTRTEWQIAAQELLTAILTARAFNNAIYRRGKYRLLAETVQFQTQIAQNIGSMAKEAGLPPVDLLLSQVDVTEAQNALGPGRSLLVVAENDLRRAMGVLTEQFDITGSLESQFLPPPTPVLIRAALERRPDLHGFEFIVQEAEQRLRLEIANRYGNPSFGPAFEENETSVSFVGMWLIWQLPIINTRRGEIRLREAEKAQAMQAVRQSEIQVQQDVYAALARLQEAVNTVNFIRTQILPQLRRTRETIDQLYAAGAQKMDLARVIDIRRRLLRARDMYLDALFEQSQAQVDLAAAVGDLSLIGCHPSPDQPVTANQTNNMNQVQ